MNNLVEKVHALENKYRVAGKEPSMVNVPESELVKLRRQFHLDDRKVMKGIVLATFPEKRRKIIELHGRGLIGREIAQRLGHSLTTVNNVIKQHERGDDR